MVSTLSYRSTASTSSSLLPPSCMMRTRTPKPMSYPCTRKLHRISVPFSTRYAVVNSDRADTVISSAPRILMSFHFFAASSLCSSTSCAFFPHVSPTSFLIFTIFPFPFAQISFVFTDARSRTSLVLSRYSADFSETLVLISPAFCVAFSRYSAVFSAALVLYSALFSTTFEVRALPFSSAGAIFSCAAPAYSFVFASRV
mmetsp:Transcript_9691/g.23860  ORF Transcript_9691/g.23860 Transcript_9691/m.23860 type:complete len:200 (-) Transcript_9691:344-943(-)